VKKFKDVCFGVMFAVLIAALVLTGYLSTSLFKGDTPSFAQENSYYWK